jgi:hypothetical protein
MKDFCYRIAKDDHQRLAKKSDKLTAAEIRIKVETMRNKRQKEATLRDLRSK